MINYKKSLLTLLLGCAALITFGQRSLAPLPKSKNGFIVIAHRGSHLEKPENSIASIEDAIRLGVDYVELDLRTTKDGHLVLLHNETIDANTDRKGRIQDLTLEEVQALKLNAKDGQLHRLPSFKEALKACKNRINIYLDFKQADVLKAYEEIKATGMEKQVLVYVNKAEQYQSWRAIAPQMPLMSRLPREIKTKEELNAFLDKMPLEATDNIPDLALVPAIRENGISIFLDVQMADEDAVKWKAAMDKGVQGVQTDHPQALINYLKTNNLRNGVGVLKR